MSYRVERAKQGRAGCQATHCKKEGVKIAAGELRQGVLVEINEHQSYRWRHWGCITPEVLHNWSETCGMDMELVDGYDELPADVQAKVKRALEQKHVDDDDFNGDLEMNRYVEGVKNRGLFVKTPKKKAKKDYDDDESEASPLKKKAPKKRGRAAADDDDAEPAPKKTKSRSKKAAKEDEDVAEPEDAPKQPAKRGRKAKDSVVDEAEPAPAKKATKGKKAKPAAKVDSDTIGEDEPPPPKKTGTKKGTKKAAAAPTNEDDNEVPDVTAAPSKKRKGRAKKAAAEEP